MKVVYRDDQKDIMNYTSGTMGIQAVPGAGKTFIITHLVSKLLENMVKNRQDGKILVLTYMNSAANNFRARIKALTSSKDIPSSRFEVMTIHSLAMSIIKDNSDLAFVNSETVVIDDYKKDMLLDNAVERYLESCSKNPIMSFVDWDSVDKSKEEETAQKWMDKFKNIVSNAIKLLKYENIDSLKLEEMVKDRAEKYSKEKKDDYRGIMSVISPIYSLYQEEMNSAGYMDYDDILLIAYNILKENPEVAQHYQNKYRYVFEDECQDSNLIQGKIIEIIADNKSNRKNSNRNLVRVGDVNQSITGTFTGSDPSNFINFCKAADRSFNMDMASRSSKDIIDLANYLVNFVNANNQKAYWNSLEKLEIKEVQKGVGYKENPQTSSYEIMCMQASDDNDNTEKIINKVRDIKKKNPNYSIGILSFANFSVDALAEDFELANIDFEKLGGNSSERKKVINDLKLAVDFLINPDDAEKFVEFVTEAFIVRRGVQVEKNEEVNPEDVKSIRKYFKKVDVEKWIYDDEYYSAFKSDDGSTEVISRILSDTDVLKQKYDISGVREKLRRICGFSQVNPSKLVEQISYEIDLDAYERQLVVYVVFYLENLVSYENADLERVSIALDGKYSRVFDAAVDSIYDVGEKEPEPGSVTLATLHKSKGMEWDAVIITGMNTNNFPSGYNDYFMSDIKYLKANYSYPEADVNRDLDYFTGKKLRQRKDYEYELKRAVIAERVRLLYVGITRAKKNLTMMWSQKETNRKNHRTFNKRESIYYQELAGFIRTRL